MAYSAQTFVADEQPTTAKWNILWTNDASFNDGSGIGSGVITPVKRSGGFFMGSTVISASGSKAITGVGFQPKAVMFMCSTEASPASAANSGFGVGFAVSASSMAAVTETTRNSNGGASETNTSAAYTVSTIAAGGGSKSINIEGVLSSLNADGFTINTTTYAASKTLVYVCFG